MPEYDAEAFDEFLGEEVVDLSGSPIGTFACYWEHQEGKPVLLGVDVNGNSGATHLLPAKGARLDERKTYVVVHFSKAKVEKAPCLECACDLDPKIERRAFNYYGADAFDYDPTKAAGHELRKKLRPESSENAVDIPGSSTKR
jgi:hypothetical protein